MVIGTGVDVINVKRIELLYKKFSNKFLQKNYHELEIEIFEKLIDKKKMLFLAKRFAGKEAISKAFGEGIGTNGLKFKDIAILNNSSGAPIVKLHGRYPNENKYKIHISLSDDYPVAFAFAVISL